MTTRLVLWDIDHTVLDTRGVGQELSAYAFRKTTGLEMRRRVRVDGLTERVIFRETAKLNGLATTHKDFEAFAQALTECHRCHRGTLRERGRVLPGAGAVLGAVNQLPDVGQTVVTGNIRGSAEIKLAAFGLDRHLDLTSGAYGDEHDDRSELVALALRRAACPSASAVLVGDTPHDVRAGLTHKVRVVAVATGKFTEDELRSAGAQVVVPDLTATRNVVNALIGRRIR
ncbi:HAD family hydrolase [Streptomyces ureilyticus]|uniref:HAD hydrolase-like protein n=1 Tax=Streptomyces ureilyticus TaxID=1775131 RepID=A0ABX0DIP5_9ACTN|nr:HAD hydrolase-like protein [Streptomyces ureilyticus]NGO41437.1 HAD hydrolase-like protein [Streptomyces ureilyticus]